MQKTLHNWTKKNIQHNTAMNWMLTTYAKLDKYNCHVSTLLIYLMEKNRPMLIILFNLIQAICTLHWIFGVSNCICGGTSCKFSLLVTFSCQKIQKPNWMQRIMQKLRLRSWIGNRHECASKWTNGTVRRERSREVNGFLLQCMNGYWTCTQKCAFCAINDYCKPILSIFILGVASSGRSPSSCKWSVLTVLNHFYARQLQQMQLLKNTVPTFTKMAYCMVWRETCIRNWSWIPNLTCRNKK